MYLRNVVGRIVSRIKFEKVKSFWAKIRNAVVRGYCLSICPLIPQVPGEVHGNLRTAGGPGQVAGRQLAGTDPLHWDTVRRAQQKDQSAGQQSYKGSAVLYRGIWFNFESFHEYRIILNLKPSEILCDSVCLYCRY